MSPSAISFYGFVVLNAVLAWGVGLLLWRRIAQRASARHIVVTVMLALSFAFGAVWFNLVHVRTLEPLPANTPRGDTSRFGLVVLAGVGGIILLILATLLALTGYAIWDYVARHRPGTTPKCPDDSG